jgi:hypothetical protein
MDLQTRAGTVSYSQRMQSSSRRVEWCSWNGKPIRIVVRSTRRDAGTFSTRTSGKDVARSGTRIHTGCGASIQRSSRSGRARRVPGRAAERGAEGRAPKAVAEPWARALHVPGSQKKVRVVESFFPVQCVLQRFTSVHRPFRTPLSAMVCVASRMAP